MPKSATGKGGEIVGDSDWEPVTNAEKDRSHGARRMLR